MAYDHEAVDSFVKGRDNKPRFAWVIRCGVDRSRNSKLRRDTGVSGQPSAIVQRSFSPHPSSLEEKEESKERSFRNFCLCFWFNETQSPRWRGWESTVIDRYRVVISSNAIEVFRNDVVCFSSILRVSYRKLRRRKYPPIHGEDFKMGSPFGRAWEGWLEDGKWDKLDRWKKDIAKSNAKKTGVKR